MSRAPIDNSVGDIAPRVRHLEVEVGELKVELREGQRAMLGKLDQLATAVAQSQAAQAAKAEAKARPHWTAIATVGISATFLMIALVGATVGTITYVASNAQREDISVLKEKVQTMRERVQSLERTTPRSARVTRQED